MAVPTPCCLDAEHQQELLAIPCSFSSTSPSPSPVSLSALSCSSAGPCHGRRCSHLHSSAGNGTPALGSTPVPRTRVPATKLAGVPPGRCSPPSLASRAGDLCFRVAAVKLRRTGAAPDQQDCALPLHPPLCFPLAPRQRSLSDSLISLVSSSQGPTPWTPMLYPESTTAAVSRQIRPGTAGSRRLRHGPPIPRPPPCRLASATPLLLRLRHVPTTASKPQRCHGLASASNRRTKLPLPASSVSGRERLTHRVDRATPLHGPAPLLASLSTELPHEAW